MKVRLGEKEN